MDVHSIQPEIRVLFRRRHRQDLGLLHLQRGARPSRTRVRRQMRRLASYQRTPGVRQQGIRGKFFEMSLCWENCPVVVAQVAQVALSRSPCPRFK